MSEVITLNGEGASLSLEIERYERHTNDPDDSKWLICRLSFTMLPVQGSTDLSLWTTDLTQFRDHLQGLINGERTAAEMTPIEGIFACAVTLDSSGHARISANICIESLAKVDLSFVIISDKTYLRQTILELSRAISVFPSIC